MRALRILIVEDDPDISHRISNFLKSAFEQLERPLELSFANSVSQARKLAKTARTRPYDLVTLDVNLGDPVMTGLDVLETLHRFKSAWMVALLTGLESDDSLDSTIGSDQANILRQSLRPLAYRSFPAERLTIVEKPSTTLGPQDQAILLENRLRQIIVLFRQIERLRFIFRPIEVEKLERIRGPRSRQRREFIRKATTHWQIRFDCGEIRTLGNLAGFRTLHYLLSHGRERAISPEEALAVEPKQETALKSQLTEDPVAQFFETRGIRWHSLTETERNRLIRAALAAKFERFCELRQYEDDDDLAASEEAELIRIREELGPLENAAESAYERLFAKQPDQPPPSQPDPAASAYQDGLSVGTPQSNNIEGSKGRSDSTAAQLFRARMKRVKDNLRENGFADFAQHLDDYVSSTGRSWSYHPPEAFEWTL